MNWKFAFIILGCSVFSLIFGMDSPKDQEDSIEIQSGEAEYNGKEISLNGDVTIQHELGRISAHHLTLTPSADKEKKTKFSFLKMQGDVVIESKQGSRLYCQEAELDYAHLKGIFLGNLEYPDVSYIDQGQKKGEVPFFLNLKSTQMQVDLERHYNPNRQAHVSSIRQIQADHQVRAYYNQEYTILADHALYQRLPSSINSDPIQMLYLYADTDQGLCHISNQNGDQLQARQVTIYLDENRMVLDQPKGMIRMQREKESQQPMHFSAEQMTWDEREQRLLLKNHVALQLAGLGELQTDKEISVYQHVLNGKKGVHTIVSPEETLLTYIGENDIAHRILCHGPLVVDHAQARIWMQSPMNEDGIVPHEKQVFFENIAGDMYANQVELSYKLGENTLIPLKLNLNGKVQIFNRFDGHLQESGSILQYALADNADYFPGEKEIILTSYDRNRVLLFDKVNNLRMSAPSVKIRHDEKSNKQSIKGVGDVRFTFIEGEFKQLKQALHSSKSRL